MFRNHILPVVIILFFTSALSAQIQLDRVETNYVAEPSSTTIIIDAAKSVTLKPNSHLKAGSNVIIKIDEEKYIAPTLSAGNYIYTRNYQIETTTLGNIVNNRDVIEKISYYDGLGRSKQDIDIKFTPDRQDLITHKAYDNLGMPNKEYLPYKAQGNNGSFRSDALSKTNSFYVNNYGNEINVGNPNPYSEKSYEDAVLNRPLKMASPGYVWRMGGNNEIEYEYKLNSTADAVRLFEVDFVNGNTQSPQLVENGTYGINQLIREIVKDENHSGNTKNHTTEEFKDKRGLTVLKRTYADIVGEQQAKHDTYFVYDDFGNLTYVIPPKASDHSVITTAVLNEICYQYMYDEKNRQIEKKLPGKDKEYIVYNKMDQPVLTQDANLDAQNKWLFTMNDAFGRIAYTGIRSTSDDRGTVQNYVNGLQGNLWAAPLENSVTAPNTPIYYDSGSYPASFFTEIHTINYYDDYDFLASENGLVLPNNSAGTDIENYDNNNKKLTKGLLTGSKIRVLDTNLWITTVNGYDKLGRIIYTKSINSYLGTTDVVTNKLNFVGNAEEKTTIHTKGNTTITTVDSFTYDHMARLITHKQSLNNATPKLIVNNEYDDLGQLVGKGIGGNENQSRLQEVDYTYNIRGWLTGINDVNSNGNLFNFNIGYDQGPDPLYNGNISQTQWRTQNDDSSLKSYDYTYDALNRITAATDNTGKYNLSNVSYDKNGNIRSLNRKGHTNEGATTFDDMDNLTYTYDSGNKLLSVTDAIITPEYMKGEFKDGNKVGNDYVYDANGNMIKDLNKNIKGPLSKDKGIEYNHLNLPTKITMESGSITNFIYYVYDALGVKQQKKVVNTYQSEVTTQYAGNYVYKKFKGLGLPGPEPDFELQFFNHPEGYVEPDGSGFNYVYQYKDHLNNVRLAYSDLNGNGSIDPSSEILYEKNYYPFGLEHKGYNNVINGTENNYQTYQGQEIHKELDLNAIEFKHRFYYPETGRFWSIDPLSEKYSYNSTYAFSENKMGMGIELEGLEIFPTQYSFRIAMKVSELQAKFNEGGRMVANANSPVVMARQHMDPSFDSESARVERIVQTVKGANMMAEATADVAHVGLEAVGLVDPTGITDAINAVWYAAEGNYAQATLSSISILPYLGDAIGKGGKGLLILGKAHKIGKYAESTKGANHMFKEGFGLGLSGLSESNTIMQAMYKTVDNGGKLLFDLGDVSLDAAKNGFKSFDAASEAGKITEWELSKVLRDKDLFNNAVFHIDGAYKSASELGLKLID